MGRTVQARPLGVIANETISRGGKLIADCTKDLEAISRLLQQFPDQPVPGTVQSLLDLLNKDRCSVPRLIQRINAVRLNGSEDNGLLRDDLSGVSATDLKAVIKKLGSRADDKQAALTMLYRFLDGEQLPDPDAEKIKATYQQFMDIYNQIPELSVDQIRTRFKPIAKQPKDVLEKLAEKLGRQFRGSKKEISDQLIGILEGKKGSEVQTELIGSS